MSTSCRIITGLTLEIQTDLHAADFRKWHEFEEKHPELDEYNCDSLGYNNLEGKLLLIGDGMNGDFLRLVKVDKLVEGGSLGPSNEFIQLNMPEGVLSQELIRTMSEIYKEYTGEYPKTTDFKYAVWSQWS